MHLTQFLPLFVGTAAAIDIYINTGPACTGSYSLCEAVPPNICCGVVVNYSSVAFLGVPTDWHLELRGHRGGICNVLQLRENVQGVDHYCLYQRKVLLTGGGYSFISKKRDEIHAPEECSAAPSQCGGFQRPNKVGFEDGVQYDLTLLDEAAGDEILAIVGRDGSSAEVPAIHDIARITE